MTTQTNARPRLRIFTWHVHGTYLYYLSHAPHDFYLPVKPGRPECYSGRSGHFPWPDNVHEVDADQVRHMDFDVVLFQAKRNYLLDQYEVLSDAQRSLPQVYLEHDPPREHPTDTRHVAADSGALIVHVTAFNALMWDNGSSPVAVIRHGVPDPGVRYTGEVPRGIVVVNNIAQRGRRTGLDIFQEVARRVPLDLAGMGSEALRGLGDLPYAELLRTMARYRFFFNPIRYTSLGLAVCEAMMLGMPVVALATTEQPAVLRDGETGFIDTDVDRLVEGMKRLLEDGDLAGRMGNRARDAAERWFDLGRFTREWSAALANAVSTQSPLRQAA